MGALDDAAKKGLRLFIEVGCANCHDGTLLGGMRYAKFGLFEEVSNTTGDEGRARVTQLASDQRVFKIPQLRNVAMTPPYFHDGAVEELNDAIRIMGKVQLNRELTPSEIQDLRAFLESLSGPVPSHFSSTLP
jgi:cytochrome c peroxidase